MRKVFFLMLLSWVINFSAFSQSSDDPVLFTVNNKPVHASEFTYIYDKTNGNNADYSKESLDEYLDLYTKFKLKVERAREMQLDTISSLQSELAGYRRQLADSYLMDKEVTEKLAKEAYERKLQDVDISHILVPLATKPSPTDTAAAWVRVTDLKKLLDKGADFATIAKEHSADKSAPRNGGRIGFVNAMFPTGYYNMETAAYTLPVNKVHGPIRTIAGYHLLKIHERRPARGEMEVGHILVRKPKEGIRKDAKARIDSIYEVLQGGANFETLAQAVSEDKISASKGGYLGFFGINRYERTFEDAAFALKKDREYTKPIETSIGWHIIRRIKSRPVGAYDKERIRLQGEIKKDPRFDVARQQVIEGIKKKANYTFNQPTYDAFVASLGEEFTTYKWRLEKEFDGSPVLFTLGPDTKITLDDFGQFLRSNSRDRIRLGQQNDNASVAQELFNKFLEENVVRYEESNLEERYPEFKSLMREYEEGILLFEATKLEVWDKASKDTVGLQAFFKTVADDYVWKERARVSIYTLKPEAKTRIDELRKLAEKLPAEAVKEKFTIGNERLITHKEETFEKGRNEVLDAMKWKVGEMSKYEINNRDQSINFFKIEEVIPAGPKSLNEARGYVIAQYQDVLEKEWVDGLRKKFPIDVNKKTLNNLGKSKK